MKKLIALFLVLVTLFCLTACSSEKKDTSATNGTTTNTTSAGSADPVADAAAKYGINLTAEGEQKMSDERAAMSVLVETKDVFLGGSTMFFGSDKTYADFVAHIGCDASYYSFSGGQRNFTWCPEGNDSAKLMITFADSGKGWTLSTSGSVNIK